MPAFPTLAALPTLPTLVALVALAALLIIFLYRFNYFGTGSSQIKALPKDGLVLFHAPWCGHCHRLMPKWRAVKEMIYHDGRPLQVLEVNADESRSIVLDAGVNSFPTIILYENGVPTVYEGDRSIESIYAFAH